jgi:hypothetical protein
MLCLRNDHDEKTENVRTCAWIYRAFQNELKCVCGNKLQTSWPLIGQVLTRVNKGAPVNYSVIS